MSYKNLRIWQEAVELSIEVHQMTLKDLPKFEMYEEGSQIRRSSKSIRSNIVEGYGRRIYAKEYIRFLIFAHASCDETLDHLMTLFQTQSLRNEDVYQKLKIRTERLGKMINVYISRIRESL